MHMLISRRKETKDIYKEAVRSCRKERKGKSEKAKLKYSI